jgi:hypothetical protein
LAELEFSTQVVAAVDHWIPCRMRSLAFQNMLGK